MPRPRIAHTEKPLISPSALLHQLKCVAPPLTSQYLNKIPSRGVNLTPGVMRALLCSPQQLYTSHYRFPGNQISSVMNKSKAATNNRFHSHAINQSFLPSIVRNNYLCPSNQNRVSPEWFMLLCPGGKTVESHKMKLQCLWLASSHGLSVWLLLHYRCP